MSAPRLRSASRWRGFALALALGAGVLGASSPVHAHPTRTLKVCADSDNLPFSNRSEEGFDNRIAALIAQDLNAAISYVWWGPGSGFLHSSLTAGQCDIVMGLPRGIGVVPLTRPYYRSSYAFVYRNGKYPQLRSLDDPRLRSLKIGVGLAGEESSAPVVDALARRKLTENVVPHPVASGEDGRPHAARVIETVIAGKADVALVWGPVAGYFASRHSVPLSVVAVSPGLDPSGMPMHFDIAVGVRPGDAALRDEIDGVLERRRNEIQGILREYSVPLVSATVLSV